MSSTSNDTSPTRLRQIALVSEDLERAKHLLVWISLLRTCSHGLLANNETQTTVIGTEVIFVDPGVGQWGLKNILGIPLAGYLGLLRR
jgi:hypothetical protein